MDEEVDEEVDEAHAEHMDARILTDWMAWIRRWMRR